MSSQGSSIERMIRLRAGRPKHHGSFPGRGKIFASPLKRPDRLSLLFNGHRWFFPWRQSGRKVNLTTHLHPVPRSRISKLYSTSPYAIMACIGTLSFALKLFHHEIQHVSQLVSTVLHKYSAVDKLIPVILKGSRKIVQRCHFAGVRGRIASLVHIRTILADMRLLITTVLTGMRFVTFLVLRTNDGETYGGLFQTMNTLQEIVERWGEASSRLQAQLACHTTAVLNRTSYLNVTSALIRHSGYLIEDVFVQAYSRMQTASSR
jgi:hypothetical protein